MKRKPSGRGKLSPSDGAMKGNENRSFLHTLRPRVRLCLDILSFYFIRSSAFKRIEGSVIPSCRPYEAGARDGDASPTTMSCFGLWSGLMGCWPALSRILPSPQHSSSHTLNPSVSLWGGALEFRPAPDRWSRSRSQEQRDGYAGRLYLWRGMQHGTLQWFWLSVTVGYGRGWRTDWTNLIVVSACLD